MLLDQSSKSRALRWRACVQLPEPPNGHDPPSAASIPTDHRWRSITKGTERPINIELDGPNISHQAPDPIEPVDHRRTMPECATVEKLFWILTNVKTVAMEHVETFERDLETKFQACEDVVFDFLDSMDCPIKTGMASVERGRSLETGDPYVRICHTRFRDTDMVKKFHAQFSSSRRRSTLHGRGRWYSELKEAYEVVRTLAAEDSESRPDEADGIKLPLSSDSADEKVVIWKAADKDTYTLCGVRASIEGGRRPRQCTIGGVLDVKGEPFALTAWHADLEDPEPRDRNDYIMDFVRRLVGLGSIDDDLETPIVVASTSSCLAATDGPATRVGEPTKEPLGTITRKGIEWALTSIDNPARQLPNFIEIGFGEDTAANPPGPFPRRHYLRRVEEPMDQVETRSIYISCSISGTVQADISARLSTMRVASGTRVKVWSVRLSGDKKGQQLQEGDSGSWALDPDSGTVFGQVIACVSNVAYLLPLKTIMDQIGDCSLYQKDVAMSSLSSRNLVESFPTVAQPLSGLFVPPPGPVPSAHGQSSYSRAHNAKESSHMTNVSSSSRNRKMVDYDSFRDSGFSEDPDPDMRFACPFRKRNPTRFNIKAHPACAHPFPDITRVKRHIYYFHRKDPVYSCPRCAEKFDGKGRLEEHLRQVSPCLRTESFPPLHDHDPENGITAEAAAALLTRVAADRIDSWDKLWRLIFPNDMRIPLPDFVRSGPLELVHIEATFREEQNALIKLVRAKGNLSDEASEIVVSSITDFLMERLSDQVQSLFGPLDFQGSMVTSAATLPPPTAQTTRDHLRRQATGNNAGSSVEYLLPPPSVMTMSAETASEDDWSMSFPAASQTYRLDPNLKGSSEPFSQEPSLQEPLDDGLNHRLIPWDLPS